MLLSLPDKTSKMNYISPLEVSGNRDQFTILDIREPYEHSVANIGDIHIPMAEVCARCEEFDRSDKLVVMCRSGKRAEAVANMLETEYGFGNIYIMEGGILAWAEQVDPSLKLD